MKIKNGFCIGSIILAGLGDFYASKIKSLDVYPHEGFYSLEIQIPPAHKRAVLKDISYILRKAGGYLPSPIQVVSINSSSYTIDEIKLFHPEVVFPLESTVDRQNRKMKRIQNSELAQALWLIRSQQYSLFQLSGERVIMMAQLAGATDNPKQSEDLLGNTLDSVYGVAGAACIYDAIKKASHSKRLEHTIFSDDNGVQMKAFCHPPFSDGSTLIAVIEY